MQQFLRLLDETVTDQLHSRYDAVASPSRLE